MVLKRELYKVQLKRVGFQSGNDINKSRLSSDFLKHVSPCSWRQAEPEEGKMEEVLDMDRGGVPSDLETVLECKSVKQEEMTHSTSCTL